MYIQKQFSFFQEKFQLINGSVILLDSEGKLVNNLSFSYSADMDMNSRYMEYSLSVKCTAFIPNILGFIMLFTLVSLYGRFPPNQVRFTAELLVLC